MNSWIVARGVPRFVAVWAPLVLACGCGAWDGHSNCSCCPDRIPLGSVNRAHYQAMETNAEAADFILYRNEFVANGAGLTSYGKDHVLEIAARAGRVPFPVIVERSENNSDPGLDQRRRGAVIEVLAGCGIPDAAQRTVVAPAYGRGLSAAEIESPQSSGTP